LPYYQALVAHVKSANKQVDLYEIIPSDTISFKKYLERAEQFAEQRGYKKIPSEYNDLIVPGIVLDLADPDRATVFNCLFVDTKSKPKRPCLVPTQLHEPVGDEGA
jgi:hypothetical protein